MGKRIKLALAIHNHQPVGNFDFVFEESYNKAYLPFLEALERHPKIRLAQHFTGPLYEWIVQNRPVFLERTQKLVASGQIEVMSGGFYEPILTVIPQRDRIGQIKKMNRFVQENFAYKASGMWLAERIWEPNLPSVMSEASIDYVVLDDSHFKGAGLNDDDLYGHYITEDQGRCVRLFPIIEAMRYNIPFASPESTIDFLRSRATDDGERLVVYADDGEKFGVWPETYEHCYGNGWVESFFQALEANSDWIELIHLSEAAQQQKPLGKIYLPTASYREMMEWSMPTTAIHQYEEFEARLKQEQLHDRFKVFVKGGFWRNFMAKYPEANQMHKRMLTLSRRVQQFEADFGQTGAFKQAQDLLWAGQCNCPYWHGVFGGLYLSHLRFAIYRSLIQADAILDKLQFGQKEKWLQTDVVDFDSDGLDEVIISNSKLWLAFSPGSGGALTELDFKPCAINLLDTMTRREEAYHKKLRDAANKYESGDHEDASIASIHDRVVSKEEGLEKRLQYDWYRRVALIDHFVADDVSLDGMSKSSYRESGDFVNAEYGSEVEKSGDSVRLVLSRNGNVQINDHLLPVELTKEIKINASSSAIEISYRVRNRSEQTLDCWFGSELAFALLAGDAPDRYYSFPGKNIDDRRLRSHGETTDVAELSLTDEWLKLKAEIALDAPARIWRFPIETISQSEGGFERVYQSSTVLPMWKLNLAQNEVFDSKIVLSINTL